MTETTNKINEIHGKICVIPFPLPNETEQCWVSIIFTRSTEKGGQIKIQFVSPTSTSLNLSLQKQQFIAEGEKRGFG